MQKRQAILAVLSILAILSLLLVSHEARACASCGCSINADWGAQGLSTQPGWSVDLRVDALDQNQLRAGTHSMGSSQAAATINPSTGGPAEVEQYTRNRYSTLTLDYSDGRAWGWSATLPHIQRKHSTLGTGSDGAHTADGAYVSNTTSVGDIRLLGRYFGFSEEKNWGLQAGLKLPTGSHKRSGISMDPASPGEAAVIDRGLQPGSGSTDLILGVYRYNNLSADWSYFAQSTFQAALLSADGYRPGNSLSLAGGWRYHGWDGPATPLLQINVRHARADSGPNADTFATGGTLVYLTPGLEMALGRKVSAYGFWQLPIYQNLRGIQLTPHYVVSLGLRYSFR